jgi:23S rRNA (cytosine1962-C5)-methyltransferase
MEHTPAPDLEALLTRALEPRLPLLDDARRGALRLFNGFTEGNPALVADLYGHTLLLLTHKASDRESHRLAALASDYFRSALTGIDCVILKQRSSDDPEKKRGEVIHGGTPDTSLLENGVNYALDLLMNQDAGFYIDTRNLRAWLRAHSAGLSVLNTFAYTGSLGVAALAGGAEHVTQIDRSGKFLALAHQSVGLSGLDASRMDCTAVDFFVGVGQMKRAARTFNMVILDPPFFSITERGRVDQVNEATRLVNKARPLVTDGGYLIVVNNALFLSGQQFIDALEAMGRDGYVSIEELIPIPEDVTGFALTRIGSLPVDPAPFNHSTKIAVLKVRKKQA